MAVPLPIHRISGSRPGLHLDLPFQSHSRSPTNTLALYAPLKLRKKSLNMHGNAQKAALFDACSCLHNHNMSADNRSGPECTGMGLELPYLSEELPCSNLLNPNPVFSSGSEGMSFSFLLCSAGSLPVFLWMVTQSTK